MIAKEVILQMPGQDSVVQRVQHVNPPLSQVHPRAPAPRDGVTSSGMPVIA